jgi:L-alanine-DL-glutamate epimerase-like enolase superfamily enzyme
MKITRIEILLLEIPYEHPFHIALAVMDRARNLVVRLQDRDGLIGVGEGCPAPFLTGETPETALLSAQDYARILLGKDPLEIQARLDELEDKLLGNETVRCAFDLALHDLLAKQAGLPLYAVFGGKRQVIQSNRTIGLDTPEAMAAAARSLVQAGASCLKVKVGTGLEADLDRVRSVRQAIGKGIPIRLDVNQAWDETTARRALQALADEGIQFCEQPLPGWNEAGLKRVRENSPIAIMADESLFNPQDAFRLASAGAVDFFNIKLGKAAGLRSALKINAIAEAAGIRCMLGGMAESLIGVSAAAHLICACPNINLADLDSPFHFAANPIQGGVDFQADGTVTLNDLPGHGADVSPEWLGRLQPLTVE